MPARILWLAKGMGRGGAEQLLVSMVPLVDRTQYEIEIAYLLPWKDALVEEAEALGTPVHCLDGAGRKGAGWPVRLRHLVRDGRFDLVHTHMPYPAAVARTALPRRLAMVHTEHNVWERYRPATRIANALTYSRNGAVLAVSDAVAGSIRRPAPIPARRWPRVEVVHQGIDTERFPAAVDPAAVRRDLGIGPDELVIGTVGNFTEKKDQRTLLEAFAALSRGRDGLRLVLVGTGPLEAALRQRAAELAIDGRVTFAGMRDDVPAVLRAFDVFALSSRYEGLSIALLEAMATGLACVATDVGGISELVTDGIDGVLVGPGDAGGLERSIRAVIEDPSHREALGAAAHRRASAFGLDTTVRQMVAIYEGVLGPR